jgi:hypothetical protein
VETTDRALAIGDMQRQINELIQQTALEVERDTGSPVHVDTADRESPLLTIEDRLSAVCKPFFERLLALATEKSDWKAPADKIFKEASEAIDAEAKKTSFFTRRPKNLTPTTPLTEAALTLPQRK